MSEGKRRRVVFVGIDGATWDIIEPMVAAGRLPNLAAMMREGSHGPLTSTIPPNSSLAWASFQTGVHPGKHGVFFFREQRPGSYQRPIISFRSIQAPTIWKLAGELGKKVAVVTFPLTFPPEPVNGAMIGGLLTPDRNADFIHPPELRAELEQAIGDVPSDNEPERLFHDADEQRALESLLHVTEQVTRMGEYLLEKHDPDLFALVFRGVDLASHQAWCYQDPEWQRRNPDAVGDRAGLLTMVYERVDAALGRFRERVLAMDGEVAFGCCSDHGFGPISYRFFLNRWLVEEGYLVLKSGAAAAATPARLWMGRKWRGLLRRTGVLRRRAEKGAAAGTHGPEQHFLDLVDWSKTRAYSSFSGGEDIVLVNLVGREPEGIVKPGAEYEALRDEIAAKLLEVEAPDGTSIVSRVYRREEIWAGPQLERAPDLQFLTRDTSVNMAANPLHPRIVEPAVEGRPAMHRMHGVYLWEGRGIFEKGKRHAGPQIADMGATIMHLLGLPVDDHMDGRVMEEILTGKFRAANPIRVREGHVELRPPSDDAASRSDEENARLLETMQALGYME